LVPLIASLWRWLRARQSIPSDNKPTSKA
jgi:hypothetical protein